MIKLQTFTENLHKFSLNLFLPWVILLVNLIIIIVSLNLTAYEKYIKSEFAYGKVIDVIDSDLIDDVYVPGRKLGKQKLKVEILTGSEKGRIADINNTLSKGHNIEAESGGKYIFSIRKQDDGEKILWLYSYNRIPLIISLITFFVILVLLIGGKKGFRSLVALIFTGVVLLFILVPLILVGFDPIILSILLLSIVIVVSFILISGVSKKTLISILGTIGGIIAAGSITFIASKIAHLSGIDMEKGEQVLYIAEDYGIRVNGFLFIAILISSLGAVMDVAMGITSSMDEIVKHKPEITNKDLFNSGMIIGRDLIGTMINTLILAFTGGSLTLILMISGLQMDFMQFINIPIISIEIIQGIAGSIGIILTVPLTNIVFIMIKRRN